MNETVDYQLLAGVPLFENLPQSELERLAKMPQMDLPAGTLLFQEGDPGDRFYIVAAGHLEVTQALGTEDERLIALLGPGEFLGEMSLLNPDGLRTASVRSREGARLWELTRSDFDRLIQRQPELAYGMARVLSARMTASQAATIHDLQQKNRELAQAYEELKSAQAQIVEKEKLERELQIACDIQMSLLPRTVPQISGYDFGARLVPARTVGGDFFDLVVQGHDRVVIVVGDVSGKGVPAALFMARIHTLLHAGADPTSAPREILQRVNRQLVALGGSGFFATVLYGVLDCRTGTFSYARAGHEPPILGLVDGEVHEVPWDVGQPLGLLEDPELDEQTVTLPRNGRLLLYTDGITDGRNPEGESFGRARLLARFADLAHRSPQQVCDQLCQDLVDFQQAASQFDDITLVAVHAAGDAVRWSS